MQCGIVTKSLSGFYDVTTKSGEVFQTRARGLFRLKQTSPIVGDKVEFESENNNEGTLTKIYPRKNELSRPSVANVDVGLIIISAVDPAFSTTLLDRMLVSVEEQNIEPVIYLSKTDLIHASEKEELKKYVDVYESIGYHFIAIDEASKTKAEIKIKEAFQKEFTDKIIVFMGQSGAGKSTLLNFLDDSLNLKTGETSKALGRGKHTTRHVELLPLFGGWFADTPGFSSIEFSDLEANDLETCFPEIFQVSHQCKFNTCLHHNEPKCAVKEAVQKGKIASFRYQNYLNILEEIKNRKPMY